MNTGPAEPEADMLPSEPACAYIVHFSLGNIYSRGVKFLQVIYEIFDCDLTHGFLNSISINIFLWQIFDCDLTHGFSIHDFNKYLFYDDKFLTVI